jgi:hypothetical protein
MKAYIVTEGDFDREVLQAVLPKELTNGAGIVSGRGNHISLARSLVLRRKVPLALVLDADCVSEKLISERRQDVEELLRMAAGKIPTKVVFAVPEMEAIFFEDASLLPRVVGHELSHDILETAKIRPGQALAQLGYAKNRWGDLLQALSEEDLVILRKSQAIQEIMQFLQEMRLEKQAA